MLENLNDKTIEIRANTDQLKQDLREATAITERFGQKLSGAFIDATVKGKDLGSVLRSLALSLSRMALNQALKPVNQAFGQIFSSFANNAIKPFAKGGVLNTPAIFPIQGGIGLAGEAGPEAILPLSRGSDGRLGVGVSESLKTPNINVTFNINTNDAESFRQSESQITAMLNRAVSRGTRNL